MVWLLTCAFVMIGGVGSALAQTKAPQPPPKKEAAAAAQAATATAPSTALWTGDFDGMVKRRRIRILTPYSKTSYFIDKGVQRGIVYDAGMEYWI